MNLIAFLIFAYLIGAIPTGYWFCKCFFNLDITHHGSGNIGASNVARVLGKKWFILVFLIDAGKAYATLWFVNCIFIPNSIHSFINISALYFLTILALLIGNSYSPFLNFKGGKGVATACGIFWFLLPRSLNICFMLLWLMVIIVTKKPFLASLCSVISILLLSCALYHETNIFFQFFILLWLVLRHFSNIQAWYCNTKKTLS